MSPEQEFNTMWQQIETSTFNRSKGSWKRAVWYGGKSRTAGAIATLKGQGWGLRSGVPSGLAAGLVAGAVGGPVGLVIVVSTVAGYLIGSAIEEGLKRADAKVGDKVWGAAKNGIQKDWPEFQKNAVQVADRNIQKLNDAIKDKNTKIAALSQNAAQLTPEQLEGRMYDALRALAEVRYYRYKVEVLLGNLQYGIEQVTQQLGRLDEPLDREFDVLKMNSIALFTPTPETRPRAGAMSAPDAAPPGAPGLPKASAPAVGSRPLPPAPPTRPRMNATELPRPPKRP